MLLGGTWDFLFLGETDKDNAEGAEGALRLRSGQAEDAEKRKTRIGERDLVALERKSPPIAKTAKGGAPSSTFGL